MSNPLFPNSDSKGWEKEFEYAVFLDDTKEKIEKEKKDTESVSTSSIKSDEGRQLQKISTRVYWKSMKDLKKAYRDNMSRIDTQLESGEISREQYESERNRIKTVYKETHNYLAEMYLRGVEVKD